MLDNTTFKTVLQHTPLVSIDLLVKNKQGEYLLGMRTNRPAQGYWFVPGGRIFKNERMDDAFLRLTQGELGIQVPRQQATFLGAFEHLYEDSAMDAAISTHYVVLGYEIALDIELAELPQEQHAQYTWMSESALLASESVHLHTKQYFLLNK
ncbi:GDP-mannose mannosyl hydrolase [Pseudoalteromonas sp.]|uniref:GDP-mannose mannosyl hydrolase n=1 Tax=Pseudoalteromonas sp. TaxID=53249 RepID=UPI0026091617|nr:GDP-mannose mannosyl hydrolase [Pseudoalteromonas sp.]MCP3705218.1 GDP-mannose mannosyl hydrolase [Alteromonas sp.]MCP4058025.1 GDP-mannose mannosyl hydrolase [Pseudoalteromonas sp.]MCP4585092.1 GDP-mannose mannosyl hydrolase [Pseudoalteromonas sp.]